MDKVDCVVIGAGVIGLAVARALAGTGREVLVIESHPAIGMETSSRSSEVIHAGLYYPTGSLKARLCIAGRERLYRYCEERAIAYRRCGKLVVATAATQLGKLAAIHLQAQANGCAEVQVLTGEEARRMEPALSCIAAIHSPMTGIVDTHAYMLALQADAEHAGAVFAFDSSLEGGTADRTSMVLRVRSGAGDRTELETNTVVNCGGLWAPSTAHRIDGLNDGSIPTAYFAKGNYYSLGTRSPFSHLVYPIPESGGLGVHLTLDLGGQARFGPDVEWLDNVDKGIDYAVDSRHADKFYAEIRAYWPELPDGSLQPAYAGVRPKISKPPAPSADFLFATHGCRHYLGLYGIESPGLTASLAIADYALQLL
ncbi:MAG TPA: NAD(P)/FAD-dependent oxidoreductase [Burkholderiaceae bacterium]|nr:NAD(P)/FAD-dependent oxidoreductase [Burkholderiaceae bacterium]